MVPAAGKRKDRDHEAVASPVDRLLEGKRQKVEEASAEIVAKGGKGKSDQPPGKKVGETELASAFALASLAGLNSNTPSTTAEATPEARDVEHGEESSTTSYEARSPGNDPVPVSPEASMPSRSPNSKRVTFSPGTKETSRLGARTRSFPPRIQGQGSRMPPGFARVSGPGRPPHHMPPPSRMHMGQQHHWMPKQHEMMHGGGGPGFMGPPVPTPPPSGQWVCDYCNVASFPTYQEACAHEGACRARFMDRLNGGFPGVWGPRQGPRPVGPFPHGHGHGHGMGPPPGRLPPPGFHKMSHQGMPMTVGADYMDKGPRSYFSGSMSLSMPESDAEWLSGLNCYIRQFCVEAFSATSEDAEKSTKRGRIAVQQVGIRCCFCKLRPLEERQAAAVSYPVSLAGIYESVKRWQRVHLQLCEDVPEAVKAKLETLNTENSWIPTTRQYWADSARSLGMVDTHDGIRFSVNPARSFKGPPQGTMSPDAMSPRGELSPRNLYPPAVSSESMGSLSEGESIVIQEDAAMVPPYVFFLVRQVESCRFTEADRFVARSKGPVGYPGFQCRHCHGHAGLGKYFPVSSKSLATNSTSQNIHAHLLKCRKCPALVKEQLVALKEEKSKAPRLEPGWRKVFFEKIWGRLHG